MAAGGRTVDYDSFLTHPFLAGVNFDTLDSVQVPMPQELFIEYRKSLNKKLQAINSSIASSFFDHNESTVVPNPINDDIEMQNFLQIVLVKRQSTRRKKGGKPATTSNVASENQAAATDT